MKMNKLILSIASAVALTSPTWAIPTLQLDITGGVYDPVTETTIATTNPFTLVALYDTAHPDSTTSFFISASIIPMTSDPTSFGSFTIDGVKYGGGGPGVLNYGTPPVDTAFPSLPPHGIFPTIYAEVPFSFDPANTTPGYNTADGTTSPDTLLFQHFNINVAGLLPGVVVHFDLYDEIIKDHPADATDTDFAPFSHDAQSLDAPPVPDGGTTVL